MSFLCDNLRVQKIIFEYKARPLLAQVWWLFRFRIVLYFKKTKISSPLHDIANFLSELSGARATLLLLKLLVH